MEEVYSHIYHMTTQFPAVMAGLKRIIGLLGFAIFMYSGRSLVVCNSNEQSQRALAWGGLFFGPMLMAIQKWMDIVSGTVFSEDLGAVFVVGSGFNKTNDTEMIWEAFNIWVNAFGWFSFIAGTFKFWEAPRYNTPGKRRSAVWIIILGMCAVQLDVTIDFIGGVAGYDNAYESIKNSFINI